MARSAVVRTAGLSIIGFVGWLALPPAGGSVWEAIALVAVLALSTLVGLEWYLFRSRTEGRWRAAMDRFAEQEQAKRIPRRRGSRP